jgi:hypothetical protein
VADFSDVDAFFFHHGKLVLFVVHVRMLYGGDHRHGFSLLRTCSFPELCDAGTEEGTDIEVSVDLFVLYLRFFLALQVFL